MPFDSFQGDELRVEDLTNFFPTPQPVDTPSSQEIFNYDDAAAVSYYSTSQEVFNEDGVAESYYSSTKQTC